MRGSGFARKLLEERRLPESKNWPSNVGIRTVWTLLVPARKLLFLSRFTGWEAGIRTPITWSRERFTGFGPLLSVRFSSGSYLTCFSLRRFVSVRSRAKCLIVSHPSIAVPLTDRRKTSAARVRDGSMYP